MDATSVKAQLEELGAGLEVNEQGIVEVNLWNTQITDAGLVHLQGLNSLQRLFLADTQITDAGVAKRPDANAVVAKPTVIVKGHSAHVYSVAFSLDSKQIVSGSGAWTRR